VSAWILEIGVEDGETGKEEKEEEERLTFNV
jgi:hypothetical protein